MSKIDIYFLFCKVRYYYYWYFFVWYALTFLFLVTGSDPSWITFCLPMVEGNDGQGAELPAAQGAGGEGDDLPAAQGVQTSLYPTNIFGPFDENYPVQFIVQRALNFPARLIGDLNDPFTSSVANKVVDNYTAQINSGKQPIPAATTAVSKFLIEYQSPTGDPLELGYICYGIRCGLHAIGGQPEQVVLNRILESTADPEDWTKKLLRRYVFGDVRADQVVEWNDLFSYPRRSLAAILGRINPD